jgi:hypothetical protein
MAGGHRYNCVRAPIRMAFWTQINANRPYKPSLLLLWLWFVLVLLLLLLLMAIALAVGGGGVVGMMVDFLVDRKQQQQLLRPAPSSAVVHQNEKAKHIQDTAQSCRKQCGITSTIHLGHEHSTVRNVPFLIIISTPCRQLV